MHLAAGTKQLRATLGLAVVIFVTSAASSATFIHEDLREPPELREVAVRAEALCDEGKYVEARAMCEKGLAGTTDYETRAFYLRTIATTYDYERRFDRAIETFWEVVARFPQSNQAWWARYYMAGMRLEMAQLAEREQNVEAAIGLLEDLVAEYPHHARAHHAARMLGRAYETLEDWEGALVAYQRAVDRYAGRPAAHHCQAKVTELQHRLGRLDAAIESARKYIELFPQARAADAQFLIGCFMCSKGDHAAAVVEFDKGLSRYPDADKECAAALFGKANCQRELGLRAEARATCEVLLLRYPESNAAQHAAEHFLPLVQ